MVNSDISNKEVERYGSTVTLKTVTRTYNDYGDEERNTTSNSIKAVVNILGDEDEITRGGRYNAGDKAFFVKGTLSVNLGDIIVHSNKNYLIEEIQEGELNDTTYVKELRCKKE